MTYDPVAQMKLEEKKRAVEFADLQQEARDWVENKVREKLGDKGQVLPLVFYPSTTLSEACRPVPVEVIKTSLFKKLSDDMVFTMYMCGGVGLAAPQAGLNHRMFVLDWSESRDHPVTCINPEVVELGSELARENEACLSMPGVRVVVSRPTSAVVSFFDVTGHRVTVTLEGWAARIFLHELDHLDGKMMFEHPSVHSIERRQALKKSQRIMRGEKPQKQQPKRR